MPLTRSFNATVRERAARDPAFRAALFIEAVQALLASDLDTAKAALRAYINATIGFEKLAAATGTPVKSHAHVRRERQPNRGQSVRCHRRPAKEDRGASRSARDRAGSLRPRAMSQFAFRSALPSPIDPPPYFTACAGLKYRKSGGG
jgi:hypothetical protein